jgi:hypothetical protein
MKQTFRAPVLILAFLFTTLLSSSQQAYAGGRPVGKKRLFIIANASYFFNDKFWDQNGDVQPYADNGKYSTFSLSVSAEYGFSRRVSLLATLPYSDSFFNNSLSSFNSNSLGDASVGVSYYIANIAYRTYFSVQANLLFPVYRNTASQNHGYGYVGANTQFIASGDFKAFEKPFAFSLVLGASQYYGDLAPLQLNFAGTLGFSISKNNQLSITGTQASSFSPSKAFDPTSPVPAKDFTYTEVTATLSHNISRNKSIFFSGTRFLIGKNTGIGNTISVGYAYKF